MSTQGLWHAAVLAGLLTVPLLSNRAPAQEPPNGSEEPPASAQQPAGRGRFGQFGRNLGMFPELARTMRDSLGSWENQAVVIQAATDRFWRQHGWTDEADRFARDLSVQVAAVPPWNPFGRTQTAVEMLQKRYGLDEQQAQDLRRTIFRTTLRTIAQHAPTIMQYTQEAIAARASGLPPDPAQVAHWMTLMRPIREDMLQIFETRADDFLATLRPEQQQIARRDLEAFERRREVTDELMDKWEQGDWRPEDWGMTPEMFDPAWAVAELQRNPEAYASIRQRSAQDIPDWQPQRPSDGQGPPRGGEERRAWLRERFARRPQVAAPAVDPRTPDSWTAYVQAFIIKYGLDAAQSQTAWAILKDLRTQASLYMVTHRADLEALDRAAAPDTQAARQQERQALLAPIAAMFQELKDRLEALPTPEQRLTAGEMPPAASQPAPAATRPVAAPAPADGSHQPAT